VNPDLKDMLVISSAAGSDPRLVQGGGGNTSVKTADGAQMYVKASGTSLGQMREGRGYRLVDVPRCIAIVEDEALAEMPPDAREAAVLVRLMDCCLDNLEGRPSVETSLHAMLGRCIVHTHPSVVNGLLCAEEGQAALAELFGDTSPPYLYIPFLGAGYVLAVQMRDELRAYEQEHGRLPEVIFLENHGLFVTADDADRALEMTRSIFAAIQAAAEGAAEAARLPAFAAPEPEAECALVGEVAAAARRFYAGLFGRPVLLRFSNDGIVTDFLRLPQARDLAAVNPLSPDQVVYCKDSPVWVERPDDPARAGEAATAALARVENGEDTPLCLLVEGLGLFCVAPTPKLLEANVAMMRAALETLSIAAHFGGARGLADGAVKWLREWEVERFRSQLVAGGEAGDDLTGKVALVTGAGSGLGRGISLCLARKGVHVLLADIDLDAAGETARLIEEGGGDGLGLPLGADVTSEEAVAGLLDRAVRALGGVDVLVNCAGIAPAHALVDFPLAAWQRTLEINLTGYFLAGREAARCMIRQGTGGAIINISSKSGLEASKNNSAYNATKAGQVHLARGWALELAEHGIRVNTVCPGNVFAGSKIWNEQYIRAVAEKRGIRPEEVIPYYVNLTALKQEITADDVGEAVAFLASGRSARVTGQALVVDGGQVFVR